MRLRKCKECELCSSELYDFAACDGGPFEQWYPPYLQASTDEGSEGGDEGNEGDLNGDDSNGEE